MEWKEGQRSDTERTEKRKIRPKLVVEGSDPW